MKRKRPAPEKIPPFKSLHANVVPHSTQRYPTLGDYFDDNDYRISDMGNPAYHVAILVHEIVEWELCKLAGISEAEITKFDIEFEKLNKKGSGSEPGDSPLCPYREQHMRATAVEREVIAAFGESWAKYERACEKMFERGE